MKRKKSDPSESGRTVDPLYRELFPAKLTKGELRKIEILEEGIRQLGQSGVMGTSLEQIGRQLGLARSHVAHYFGSLDALALAALEWITRRAQAITIERVRAARTPREVIDAIVIGAVDWATRHPDHVPVMALLYHCATVDPRFRQLHTRVRDSGRERLASALKAAFPKLTRPRIEALGAHIQALITGFLLQAATTDAGISDELQKELVRQIGFLLETAG